jgi:Zn-dependent protease
MKKIYNRIANKYAAMNRTDRHNFDVAATFFGVCIAVGLVILSMFFKTVAAVVWYSVLSLCAAVIVFCLAYIMLFVTFCFLIPVIKMMREDPNEA